MQDNEKTDVFAEERELLHKQLELLAEKSENCSPHELAELSEQRVAIYSLLKL